MCRFGGVEVQAVGFWDQVSLQIQSFRRSLVIGDVGFRVLGFKAYGFASRNARSGVKGLAVVTEASCRQQPAHPMLPDASQGFSG